MCCSRQSEWKKGIVVAWHKNEWIKLKIEENFICHLSIFPSRWWIDIFTAHNLNIQHQQSFETPFYRPLFAASSIIEDLFPQHDLLPNRVVSKVENDISFCISPSPPPAQITTQYCSGWMNKAPSKLKEKQAASQTQQLYCFTFVLFFLWFLILRLHSPHSENRTPSVPFRSYFIYFCVIYV